MAVTSTPKAHRKGFPHAVRVDPIPDRTPGRAARGRRLSVTELAAFAQVLWGLLLCCVFYIQRGRDANCKGSLSRDKFLF
jgi:hypothetical protein